MNEMATKAKHDLVMQYGRVFCMQCKRIEADCIEDPECQVARVRILMLEQLAELSLQSRQYAEVLKEVAGLRHQLEIVIAERDRSRQERIRLGAMSMTRSDEAFYRGLHVGLGLAVEECRALASESTAPDAYTECAERIEGFKKECEEHDDKMRVEASVKLDEHVQKGEWKKKVSHLRELHLAVEPTPWVAWSEEGPWKGGGKLVTHSVCRHAGDVGSDDHTCVATALGETREDAENVARFIAEAANSMATLVAVFEAVYEWRDALLAYSLSGGARSLEERLDQTSDALFSLLHNSEDLNQENPVATKPAARASSDAEALRRAVDHTVLVAENYRAERDAALEELARVKADLAGVEALCDESPSLARNEEMEP